MHLIFEYAFDGGGNHGFKYVFDNIYNKIESYYPNVVKSNRHTRELYKDCDSPCGRCGISTLKIINADNNKTTVLNFWDRGIEVMMHDFGWETLNVVHVIGGLGIYMTADEIKEKYNIRFDPFLYPLEQLTSYDYIQQFRKPYILKEKIKKACFIGSIYDSRKQIADILNQHPLFEVIGPEAGLRGEPYYEKMSQYALTLSFNGNGEWCLRDVESMGLGIPTLRSEMKTPFYKGLQPGVNYIKGTEPSENAFMVYPGVSFEETAAQFIAAAENVINNEELLSSISKNNIEYYDKYLLLDNIVSEFFNVFDLEILK